MATGKEDAYFTKDLYESALLYASNQKLRSLEKDGRFFWFVFENKDVCKSLIESYWRREVKVDAKTFADALRSLKDKIFSIEKVRDGDGDGESFRQYRNI